MQRTPEIHNDILKLKSQGHSSENTLMCYWFVEQALWREIKFQTPNCDWESVDSKKVQNTDAPPQTISTWLKQGYINF